MRVSSRGQGTKSRRHSKSKSVSKSKSKDYSIFIGIGLVIFGLVMCLYTFGMLDNPKALLDLPDLANFIQLWPIIIVIIGFIFVLKDYFNKAKSQKWNS